MPALDTETVRALLMRLAPSQSEVEDRCRRARDPRYWLDLSPGLTIAEGYENGWVPAERPDTETVDTAVAHYRREGYAGLDGVLAVEQAERMRKCIETLRAHDWPPVFAFVYDAFWQVGRVPAVRTLLRELLGDDPVLLPRVWAHYVAAAVGNTGWLPHIDGRPGSAPTMSLWIPLSEATLSNGCMYVVARDEQTQPLGEAFGISTTYTAGDIKALLRRTTACPARPGQVLLWDERIIHWGAAYETGAPRVSLALEFSTLAFAPTRSGFPPVSVAETAPLPGLPFRLRTIGRALASYRRFEPLLERFAPLAARLEHGVGPSA